MVHAISCSQRSAARPFAREQLHELPSQHQQALHSGCSQDKKYYGTALEIADKLDYWTRSVMSIHNVPTLPKLCDCGEKAADMLRQQHAEIERLTSDKETLVHNANRAFYAMQGQQEDIERLTALNSALTEKGNSYVIENARQAEEIERLIAERDAAKT